MKQTISAHQREVCTLGFETLDTIPIYLSDKGRVVKARNLSNYLQYAKEILYTLKLQSRHLCLQQHLPCPCIHDYPFFILKCSVELLQKQCFPTKLFSFFQWENLQNDRCQHTFHHKETPQRTPSSTEANYYIIWTEHPNRDIDAKI